MSSYGRGGLHAAYPSVVQMEDSKVEGSGYSDPTCMYLPAQSYSCHQFDSMKQLFIQSELKPYGNDDTIRF